MAHICEGDWIGVYGRCRDCSSPVSHYTCNGELISKRPAGDTYDWWSACDNPACLNHEGEGIFQSRPNWELPLAESA